MIKTRQILSHFFDNFILFMFRALVIYHARSFYINIALSCNCNVSVHMYTLCTNCIIIVYGKFIKHNTS